MKWRFIYFPFVFPDKTGRRPARARGQAGVRPVDMNGGTGAARLGRALLA
jgi:hypothetical protein